MNLFIFYSSVAKIITRKLGYYFLGIRNSCWTLIISKGNLSNSVLFRLKPILTPKNEFWADPFIVSNENDNYVFFENYNYKTKILS